MPKILIIEIKKYTWAGVHKDRILFSRLLITYIYFTKEMIN